MPSAEKLSRLLETLYAVPSHPERWPKFLKEFTDFLELPAAAIIRNDAEMKDGAIDVSVGLDPDAVRLYVEYFHERDEYRASLRRLPRNGLTFADELCPPGELVKTEFFNDFIDLHRQGLYCDYIVSNTPSYVENISLYCDLDAAPVENDTVDRLKLVLPHLKLALALQTNIAQLGQQNADREAALHRLAVGVALLDEEGRCIFLNKTAECILSRRDGLLLRASRLTATSSREAARLDALIKKARAFSIESEHHTGGAMLVLRRGRRALQVLVSPFSSETLFAAKRATVAIIVVDPEQSLVLPAEILRALYSLTPAESRLALALAEGKELRDVCDAASIRYTTGRAHLRSIFSKTGVRRQSELLSLLVRTGLPFGSDIQAGVASRLRA
jgi:DNA-binding CsgD family transcriptional regulator